jgi:hypothetical protein
MTKSLGDIDVLHFDVETIRADFPILHQQVNGSRWCISTMRLPPKNPMR